MKSRFVSAGNAYGFVDITNVTQVGDENAERKLRVDYTVPQYYDQNNTGNLVSNFKFVTSVSIERSGRLRVVSCHLGKMRIRGKEGRNFTANLLVYPRDCVLTFGLANFHMVGSDSCHGTLENLSIFTIAQEKA